MSTPLARTNAPNRSPREARPLHLVEAPGLPAVAEPSESSIHSARLQRFDDLLVSVAVAALIVALTYVLLRLGQVLFFPEPDPRFMKPGPHIGFFFRARISLLVAAVLGAAAFFARRRAGDRLDRWLHPLTWAVGIAAAAQALFLP